MKVGRNDPCPCGSGKKYKNCCLGKADSRPANAPGPMAGDIAQLEGLFSAGRYAEAEARALASIKQYPDAGVVWKLLSLSLQMQGKDALPAMKKAALLVPDDAEAHANLAAVLRARGQLEEAVRSCRRALEIRPGFAEANINLGVALQDLGRLDEAVGSYRRAIEIRPDFAEAHNNLGGVLNKLGRHDEAADSYRRAIQLRPNFAQAHDNLGVILQELGQLQEALACFRKAVQINPGFAEAYYNMGFVLKELGQFDAALASYHRALEINPDYAEVHNDIGVMLLLLGRFAEGWKEYWWRIPSKDRIGFPVIPSADNPLFGRHPDEPLPSDLPGMRITIIGDQGLGDELFFLRFARELRRRGAWVAFLGDPRMAPFIRRANWVDCVGQRGDAITDSHAVLLGSDLPLLVGMASEADIPPPIPLPVLPEKRDQISARLLPWRHGSQPLVGITWRAGGDRLQQQMVREVPLAELGAALSGIDAAFVVIQRNPRPGETAALESAIGRPVADFSDLNEDLEGMLALMEQLDDYVGVDNTNMHLRASAGKTARILVPHLRDFRSMAKGETTPWLPGFAIYRRSTDAGWAHALAQLRYHLEHPRIVGTQ
jgi:Tfp pilus assembly protein PilF